MYTRSSAGFAHIALVIILIVMAVFGTAGYVVYASEKDRSDGREKAAQQKAADDAELARKDAERKANSNPVTDKEQIEAEQLDYCKTEYKRFWEGAYAKTIDPETITASYDDSVKDPFLISSDRAMVRAAKCDTKQLTELQKFAPFTLYFKKTDGAWQAYERYQTTPPCNEFDDGGWPTDIVPVCSDNGTDRTPKK